MVDLHQSLTYGCIGNGKSEHTKIMTKRSEDENGPLEFKTVFICIN
jgi:hypothetical protein